MEMAGLRTMAAECLEAALFCLVAVAVDAGAVAENFISYCTVSANPDSPASIILSNV